jgi:hypothetical protein
MTRLLKCTCGHEVDLSASQPDELVWCPRCRSPLSTPPAYRDVASRNFSNDKRAPASTGGGVSAGRWGWIGVVGVIGLIRLAIALSGSNKTTTPPQYRYDPPPTTRIQFPEQPNPGLDQQQERARLDAMIRAMQEKQGDVEDRNRFQPGQPIRPPASSGVDPGQVKP